MKKNIHANLQASLAVLICAFSVPLGATVAPESTLKAALISSTWQAVNSDLDVKQTYVVDFLEQGTRLRHTTICHFSELGLGEDLLATAEANIHVDEVKIEFLEDQTTTKKDNETGNFCSALIRKGWTGYKFLGKDEVSFSGELYVRKKEKPAPPSEKTVDGSRWMFSFHINSTLLTIVADFTQKNIHKASATCDNGSEKLTASVNAPVVITSKTITNPDQKTAKVSSPSGFWCQVLVPKRNMTYEWINENQIQVENDPLHPEGMIWTRIQE